MRIGLLYDRPEDYPEADGPADRFAEFEPESTIEAMEATVSLLGHEPVRIGAPKQLSGRKPDIDLIWNIAEGYGTRNREAWAPVLCELHGIPCLGSDAHTLSISLDKALTKIICRSVNVPTPAWQIFSEGDNMFPWHGPWPVFLKPRYEGTAKGIGSESVVRNSDDLTNRIRYLIKKYRQDVLAEVFLPGAEFTCAVAGTPLRALPVLERAVHAVNRVGLHTVLHEPGHEDFIHLTHHLPAELERQLQGWSLKICHELGVCDFARIDFKLDEAGNAYFLEINPLPTFAIDNTFAILAELEGRNYPEYLAGIIDEAIDASGLGNNK